MGKKKKSKSTERSAFGLTILKKSHPRVQALGKENEPEIHGDRFWKTSFLVMDYLQRQGLPGQAKVMELGCGWGLAGIFCAREFGAAVTGVDADPHVFPYMHLHAEINGVELSHRRSRFENLTKKQMAGYDLMIGAEICFWDEMVDPLYRAVRKSMKAGVQQVVIGDPGRPPFDELCEKAEKKLGGEVKEWSVDEPKAHGWLLIIGSLPVEGSSLRLPPPS